MYDPRTMPKTKRKHLGYMQDILQQLEWDLHQPILSRNRIPYAWRDIAEARYPQPKTRITLWVEKDVLRFYKSMGKGYQARMNDTMRAFMLARLSEIIREKDVIEDYLGWEKRGVRPKLGDYEKEVEALAADVAERRRAKEEG